MSYNYCMNKLKSLLKSPALALGLAPLLFALSQIIILGFQWLIKDRAGDLTLTVSRYVGLELWTSILFAIFNFVIIVIMFRYYLSLWKSRSLLWLILGIFQVIGFAILSLSPQNAFLDEPYLTITSHIHDVGSHMMFIAMFAMAFETLRLCYPNHLKFLQKFRLFKCPKKVSFPSITPKISVFFILYGFFYLYVYITRWDVIWSRVLILETGYIYAFMAFLILTRKITPSDKIA